MQKIALAATVAALIASPALAADYVSSTIASVDTRNRAVTLTDRTIMTVGKDVDLEAVKPGTKVRVFAKLDEDGYAPATAISAEE